jgi:SNF2 family DNA or RNA helicase
MLSTWKLELDKLLAVEYMLYRPTQPMPPEELASNAVILTTFDNIRQEFARYKHIGSAQDHNAAGKYDGLPPVRDSYPTMLLTYAAIIADEIGKASRSGSQISEAMCTVRVRRQLGLTGTPLENDYDEIQTLIKWLSIKPWDDAKVFNECFVPKRPKKTKARLNLHYMDIDACLRERMNKLTEADIGSFARILQNRASSPRL